MQIDYDKLQLFNKIVIVSEWVKAQSAPHLVQEFSIVQDEHAMGGWVQAFIHLSGSKLKHINER